MFSHLIWAAAAFFYVCLAAFSYSRPNLGGDQGMGYGLGLAFFGLGCILSTLALAGAMLYKGQLAAVLPSNPWRTLLAFAGALAFAVAVFSCAMLKWEPVPGVPGWINRLAQSRADIWLPILVLLPSFILLSEARRLAVPALAYQIPLALGVGLSLMICAGLLASWMAAQAHQQQALVAHIQQRDREQHEHYRRDIEAFQPTDPLVNILSFTGRFHDEDVRAAALAKIKSRPDWEGELIALLENEHYYHYAYTFLDGNPVDHPEAFAEPLRRSILLAAAEVRRSIPNSNNLQSWSFDHIGIERLLRAIDEQFASQGVDYRPALRELRQALDTPRPEQFKNVRFAVARELDGWLR